METLYQFEIPIDLHDLQKIEGIVRESEALTVFDPSFDVYDVAAYRHQAAEYGTIFKAYLDLNLLIDVVSIARSDSENRKERGKFGAAFIAFCQCSNIQIEPSIAIHECSQFAEDEVTLLRRIDNAETKDLLQVAYGNVECLSNDQLPWRDQVSLPEGIPKRLHGHECIETAVLKIASLGQQMGGDASSKLEEFLRWSHEECLFSREAIHLALIQFSVGSTRILKLPLKGDTQAQKKQISNAVWDLMHARNWVKATSALSENNEVPILCSRDKALQSIARDMVVVSEDPELIEAQLRRCFQNRLGKTVGLHLSAQYAEYTKSAKSTVRKCNQPRFAEYCKQIRQNLINEVFDKSDTQV